MDYVVTIKPAGSKKRAHRTTLSDSQIEDINNWVSSEPTTCETAETIQKLLIQAGLAKPREYWTSITVHINALDAYDAEEKIANALDKVDAFNCYEIDHEPEIER